MEFLLKGYVAEDVTYDIFSRRPLKVTNSVAVVTATHCQANSG